MKTKNLILGLVAIVFALGSAFTTANSPSQTAFVKVKLTSTSNPWECVSVNVTCNENSQSNPCLISIPDLSTSVQARQDDQVDPVCQPVLTDSRSTTIGSFDPLATVVAAE